MSTPYPPPTMAQVEAKHPKWLAPPAEAVYTFSNGTDWECWASGNCFECRYWDVDTGGALCAFECAAILDMVTPELARMFGWIHDDAAAAKYGERSAWDAPARCAFFRERPEDDEDDSPPPPDPDPRQLVLIADPTEDIAGITPAASPLAVEVA